MKTINFTPSVCPLCGRGADAGADWVTRNSIGIGGGAIDEESSIASIHLGVHRQCFEDAFAGQELPRFRVIAEPTEKVR
jgi:hypothetical protein